MQSSSADFPYRSYLAPRYWLTWLGIGLLWLLSRLPYQGQLAVGRGIGSTAARLMPSRRRVTEINLELAIPELAAGKREQLVRQVYHHVGMSIAEAATMWFRPLDWFDHHFTIEGLEHLTDAQARGKGVILLQAHFTLIEAVAAVMGSRVNMSAVVDAPKNELIGALLKHHRERYVTETIENHNIRRMVRRLRNNEIVWYSPDLYVPPTSGGIPTRYFGVPVLTTDGIARIAKLTGATLVPYMPTRLNYQGDCKLEFFPALPAPDLDDLTATTQQMNDLFEAQIRQQPEQYFWLHKRFKPPAADLKNPYR
ncbi:MAG: lysophospholipid acyltransferase family protein [Gammaproteobacteria bacterium]|nr:lysophospholipid acyltransferase family protein [Gammaproteobacteria bacterium]